MSVADDVTESNPPDRGLARRDFIRKAAVAGAIGWTAPLILQSLTSPASAVSVNCYFYVFKMSRNGNSANCNGNGAIQDATSCPTPTIISGVASCPTYTRATSTTSPVNFTVVGTCTGGATESAVFTINTVGCLIVGTAVSGGASPGPACSSSVTLSPTTPPTGTTVVTVTQTGIAQNGVWWAYLAIQC